MMARDHRPLVLYVPTCLMGYGFYAPHNRSCEYYRFLCRVTDILATLREVQAVIKLHDRADHVYNPITDRLRARHSSVQVQTGAIEPWLRRAHLVILDLPGTVLMEALAMGKRILLYARPEVWRISPEVIPLLEKATLFEQDEAAFFDRLRHLETWAGFRPPIEMSPAAGR